MSALRKKSPEKRIPFLRHRTSNNINVDVQGDMNTSMSRHKAAVASSLDSILVPPRSSSTVRTSRRSVDTDSGDGVEMSLLNGDERAGATSDLDDDDELLEKKSKAMPARDKRAMVLLIILCQFVSIRPLQ